MMTDIYITDFNKNKKQSMYKYDYDFDENETEENSIDETETEENIRQHDIKNKLYRDRIFTTLFKKRSERMRQKINKFNELLKCLEEKADKTHPSYTYAYSINMRNLKIYQRDLMHLEEGFKYFLANKHKKNTKV